MRIGTNILALKARNALSRTQGALARSLQRLASGSRINSARDDASGLARANGLDAQVRGLTRTVKNINDSMAMLQTADGAVSTQVEILQRIRELAVQAANGIYSTKDRTSINNEVQALFEEYQRISRQTTFNGVQLIDGSFGTSSIQAGTRKGDTVDASIGTTQAQQIFQKTAGTGTYSSASTISMGINKVRIADIDNDGYNDIVTLDSTAHKMNIRFGSSDGTFNTRISTSIDNNAVDFDLGDLNGDGKLDIVTENYTSNSISVLLNQSGRSFSTTNYATQANVHSVTIADFDGDGKKDIATLDNTDFSNSYISVFMNRGGGVMASRATNLIANTMVTSASNQNLVSGDFNGDGRSDIAVALTNTSNSKGLVNTYTSNASGALTVQSSNTVFNAGSTANSTSIGALLVGDLNNDGKVDLLFSDTETYFDELFLLSSSFLYRFMGSGTGSFTVSITTDPTATFSLGGGSSVGQVLGDINGDGILDRIAAQYDETEDYSAYYHYGRGDGTFTSTATKLDSGGAQVGASAIGDLNNDGVNDILLPQSYASQLFAYYQNTQSTSAVGDVSVLTQTSAKNLIGIVDTAIENLSAVRSNLGAQQNRLESSANVNLLTQENLLAAKSNLMDVDYAEETSNLVKAQILQQAQVSVLAQANFQSQLVLELLRF